MGGGRWGGRNSKMVRAPAVSLARSLHINLCDTWHICFTPAGCLSITNLSPRHLQRFWNDVIKRSWWAACVSNVRAMSNLDVRMLSIMSFASGGSFEKVPKEKWPTMNIHPSTATYVHSKLEGSQLSVARKKFYVMSKCPVSHRLMWRLLGYKARHRHNTKSVLKS